MEGEKEFLNLQNEIKAIIKNNDLSDFLSLAKEFQETDLSMIDLMKMIQSILDNK